MEAETKHTCGIRNNRNRFATCIDVALDAAPRTPQIFFCDLVDPSEQL